MLKLVHKKHYNPAHYRAKIVITYSISEIIIGILLMTLVGFYIYNYLQTNLVANKPSTYYSPKMLDNLLPGGKVNK